MKFVYEFECERRENGFYEPFLTEEERRMNPDLDDHDENEDSEYINEDYEFECEPEYEDYSDYLVSQGLKKETALRMAAEERQKAFLNEDEGFRNWLKERYREAAFDEFLENKNNER